MTLTGCCLLGSEGTNVDPLDDLGTDVVLLFRQPRVRLILVLVVFDLPIIVILVVMVVVSCNYFRHAYGDYKTTIVNFGKCIC